MSRSDTDCSLDNYDDEEFESSSDTSQASLQSLSLFDKYQNRLDRKKICEVEIQCLTKPVIRNCVSKAIQSNEESVHESFQNQGGKNIHANEILLKNFINRWSSVFDYLVVENKYRAIRKQEKELNITFGIGTCSDHRDDWRLLLEQSDLIHVASINHQNHTILTLHLRKEECCNDQCLENLSSNLQHPCTSADFKSVMCIWRDHDPGRPQKVMLSQSTIMKESVCVLKHSFVVCGAKEGIIQLWNIQELLQSPMHCQYMNRDQNYYLYDVAIEGNEIQRTLNCLDKVSDYVVASLDNFGTVKLWNVKVGESDGPTKQYYSYKLVQIKIIKGLNRKQLCEKRINYDDNEILSLKCAPSGDCFLCTMNDGRVSILHTDEEIHASIIYLPDQLKGQKIDCHMYDNVVDQIAFSPFDQDIFLLKWSDGSFGLFHRDKSVASIYLNTWNYIPQIGAYEPECKRKRITDRATDICWCKRRPNIFYVLTLSGFFLSFDLSTDELSKKIILQQDEEGFQSLSLIDSYKDGLLPIIISKNKNGNLFRIKQLVESETFNYEDDLRALRSHFHNKETYR